MKRILALLVVLLLATGTQAATGDLEIYITSVDVQWDETEGFFVVNSSVSVNNPTSSPIEFTHSDLCEFKLDITTNVDGLDTTYPYGCAEALKLVDFEPGTTVSYAIGAIHAENDTLPNGEYTLDLELASYQLDPVKKVYTLFFDVTDGQIGNVITEQVVIQNEETTSGSLIFSGFAISIAIPLIYRKRN